MKTLVTSILISLFAFVFAQDAAYPRTVTDGSGNAVTISAKPKRIAVIDPLWSLEALLSLGVAPVQVGQRSFFADYLGDPLKQWPWLEEALAKAGATPDRINADETNIEGIAKVQPDLIVGHSGWVNDYRDLLDQIAPTISVDTTDARVAITLLGEVLAMEEEAAQVIADWEVRIKNEVEGLVPAGKKVAIIRTDGDGKFASFATPGYGPYDMLTRAGFTVPEELAKAELNYYGTASEFSFERLDVLDEADVIVVLGFSPDFTDTMLEHPLFLRLPAVQAGRVVRVEQGPIAQAFAALSPLNLDIVLPVIKEAAAHAQ